LLSYLYVLPCIQGSLYFCPTRLASSLCSGARGGVSDLLNTDVAGGHIIVESNYKVRVCQGETYSASTQAEDLCLARATTYDYLLPSHVQELAQHSMHHSVCNPVAFLNRM
jgi:hypothetical protein